jgi:hypothetical protein
MSSTKTYMLVPHHDFPADGPLRLGSIILDPKEPGESLNEGDIVEVPAPSLHSSHKYNWEQTIDYTRDGRAGVWARCVHLLGLGGNFGGSLDTTAIDHYRFQDLETTYFFPSQEYLNEAVKKPDILSYLEGARYAPVYIITGLKIVRGPGSQVTSRRTIAREGHANFGLPGIWGAGPFTLDSGDMRLHQAGTTNNSFSGSTDFVIGYRLGKITFEKLTGAPKHQKHTEGAMLGITNGPGNDNAGSYDDLKVIFAGEAAAAEGFCEKELVSAIDEDDGEDCHCFIVPSESTS